MSAAASLGPLNPLSSWGSVLRATARGTLSEGGDRSAALQALPPPRRINPEARGPWAVPAAFTPFPNPAFAPAAPSLARSVLAASGPGSDVKLLHGFIPWVLVAFPHQRSLPRQ